MYEIGIYHSETKINSNNSTLFHINSSIKLNVVSMNVKSNSKLLVKKSRKNDIWVKYSCVGIYNQTNTHR